MKAKTYLWLTIASVVVAAFSLAVAAAPVSADQPSNELIELHKDLTKVATEQCINCHGNKADEKSLQADIKTPHAIHIPLFKSCSLCHKSADLLQGSAGALRRQVDPQTCFGCHGPNPSSGKQLYQVTPTLTVGLLPKTGDPGLLNVLPLLTATGSGLMLGGAGLLATQRRRR